MVRGNRVNLEWWWDVPSGTNGVEVSTPLLPCRDSMGQGGSQCPTVPVTLESPPSPIFVLCKVPSFPDDPMERLSRDGEVSRWEVDTEITSSTWGSGRVIAVLW